MTTIFRIDPSETLSNVDRVKELSRDLDAMMRGFGYHDFQGGDHAAMDDVGDWCPSLDLEETDDAYLVEAEVPGVTKADLAVSLSDGVLSIRGKREKRTERRDGRVHHLERRFGRFERRFTMPSDADPERVVATLDEGVLSIRIDKKADDDSPNA